METREITDKLLEKRAMYQQSLKAAEEAKANFRDLIESITEEQVEVMRSILGNSYFDLALIDLDRIQTDEEYFDQCQARYTQMITKLHDYLEDELNVRN